MSYSNRITSVQDGSKGLTCRVQYLDDTDPFSSTNFPEPTRPPSYTFIVDKPLCEQLAGVHRLLKAPHKIGDCTLQLSNTLAYLDLELSIAEQKEEFELFNAEGKRNSVIIRTQLSVRVHSCIEKLYNSKGRELRRALFSLKQIFQDDKDLVHEFVNADGLTCLVKVGAEADQNYQNYILRALGQIMLYVDGMEGVITHVDTIRWLYTLIASKFRLVVKTSLKLLLVFVEYSEMNATVLIQAIQHVDGRQRRPVWHNLMGVLGEKDGIDSELLVYAMTLINKILSNVSDQDMFYDITDSLEEQNMDAIAQRHLNKKGNDVDLVEQLRIYEMALKHEDGDEDITDPVTSAINGSGIKWNRERRKSEVDRKSRRRNSVTSVASLDPILDEPPSPTVELTPKFRNSLNFTESPKPWMPRKNSYEVSDHTKMISDLRSNVIGTEKARINGVKSYSSSHTNSVIATNDENEDREEKRRERLAKWQQKEISYRRQVRPKLEDIYESERLKLERRRNLLNSELSAQNSNTNEAITNHDDTPSEPPPPPTRKSTSKVLEHRRQEKRRQQQDQTDKIVNGDTVRTLHHRQRHDPVSKKSPERVPYIQLNGETHFPAEQSELEKPFSRLDKASKPALVAKVNKAEVVKDDKQSNDVITSDKKLLMDMLYSNQAVAAKQRESDEGSDDTATSILTATSESSASVKAIAEKLQASKADVLKRRKPPERIENESLIAKQPCSTLAKKDSDIMWDKLIAQGTHHQLTIDGFDFSGISALDDVNVLIGRSSQSCVHPSSGVIPSPPPAPGVPIAPPVAPSVPHIEGVPPVASALPPADKRRTVRLFWKEAATPNGSSHPLAKTNIWTDVEDIKVEADKFLHLFQLKSKDMLQKKQQTEKRNELRILDVKRSNAINIGLTILPPPRTIKSAIINMDEFALTKEQIEKLLVMVPTEEEISAIQEGMQESPDVALGSAEQFLLTLSSVSELEARLNLWSFKLDYDVLQKEVAEPLQDLKDGITEMKNNKTLKKILATLRAIGNLLNNTNVEGFDVSYLSKVPEVKDTVQKQSLLYHVTQSVLEKFPDSSDLYSELGALTRCSRVDFDLLQETIEAMETRCKNSWDYLKLIAKHESKATFRSKLSEFLISCAQNIITLKVVHRRLINRFHALLLYFGSSPKSINDTTIQGFARMISEFALEYKTARDRIVSQRNKKQARGERSRTRGKMIIETQRFSTTEEQMKQKLMENALRPAAEVKVEKRSRLRSNKSGRRSNDPNHVTSPTHSVLDDVTDPMMEQLVKTATQAPPERNTPVNRRKRSRNTQRKSLRRTLKGGLTEEEKAVIMGSY